jgi:hypothetical protein
MEGDASHHPDLGAVKSEIAFFMEKTFQVSFGYLGALAALAAAAKLDVLTAAASLLDVRVRMVVVTAVLMANAVYLTLACGTLFAVVKRGLFIIQQTSLAQIDAAPRSIHLDWEVFVRRPPPEVGAPAWGRVAAWNFDNFYMVPLFLLIACSSVGVAVFGMTESKGSHEVALLAAGCAAQVFPVAGLSAVVWLTRHAEQAVRDTKAD